MKTIFYTIYDTAAAYYMNPFLAKSDAAAMREFTDIITEPTTALNKHPEDYYLCRIGRYDDQNAKIDPEAVETLLTGLEAMAGANKQATATQDTLDFVPGNGQDLQPGLTD